MRNGITVEVSAADRFRLDALVAGRNTPQEQVWRLWFVLLTAEGRDTGEIMRRANKSTATQKAANYLACRHGHVRKSSSAGNVR